MPWRGGQLITVGQGGWEPVAPSDVPQRPDERSPQALDLSGMERIKVAFVESATRAVRLGFDALELHSAHGYLLHQFLSPISNKREDQFGGSLENRMRFPLYIFDAVREAWPAEKPLGVRVSATDWVEGGWEIEQCLAYSHQLTGRGCDWIDCSSGGISPDQEIPLEPGYQVSFAKQIRLEAGIPTIAVGLITDPQHAESIIANGEADVVALARAMLYNPRWPWHAAAALGATVNAPEQYWRCVPSGIGRIFGDTPIGMR